MNARKVIGRGVVALFLVAKSEGDTSFSES
jgi:hypothetical protein